MSVLRNISKIHWNHWQKFSTKQRFIVELNKEIAADLEKEVYKPKDHPGRLRLKNIELPFYVMDGIEACIKDYPTKQLTSDAAALNRYLFARHPPMEPKDSFSQRKEIEKEILQRAGVTKKSEIDSYENSTRIKDQIGYEIEKVYHEKTYNWKPMEYDDYKAVTYAVGRSALEYAAVLLVFSEIAKRDPDFKPQSFLDFGAGVGTGIWTAAKLWSKSLQEYFLVDTSREMNNLSEMILRGGNLNKAMKWKTVYYRQFLPASSEVKSHLILSAYSLMELPNMEKRIETLLTLWNKCDGYLVIIENGTNAGFKLIQEARDFLLQQAKQNDSAYLFAPCPHEEPCPRVQLADGTPCNFPTTYRPPQIGDAKNEALLLYSYVVIKKGSRANDSTINWPRLVRPTQVRARHTRCHLCTHRGNLEEIIITHGKHSMYTYRCARKSEWGDRIPITIEESPENKPEDSNGNEEITT